MAVEYTAELKALIDATNRATTDTEHEEAHRIYEAAKKEQGLRYAKRTAHLRGKSFADILAIHGTGNSHEDR